MSNRDNTSNCKSKAPCGHIKPTDGCRWCIMATTKDVRYARKWWGLEIDGPKGKRERRGLGDVVERALESVGITKEFVKSWIGDCGCKERKERLNKLSEFAMRIMGANK